MLEAMFGAGFVAWLGVTSAVMVGVLAAALVVQLVRELHELAQEAWVRVCQWWRR